jgi:bisphosphoglycerate-independent phosphoglycerate mutase (AlkP superfamily)
VSRRQHVQVLGKLLSRQCGNSEIGAHRRAQAGKIVASGAGFPGGGQS